MLKDGLVIEMQWDSSEQNLETATTATKDSEGGPSRIITDVAGTESTPMSLTMPPSLHPEITNVPLPECQVIASQYDNREVSKSSVCLVYLSLKCNEHG